ncbi:MAG TPA: hypothetical protein ENH10_09655 [Bacteroidetes bacterium]|nr:hypothetical protein BMS3Bbin04_01314 [bacterium BMS3Bbin04]HDO66273.1 hypothetical protein [Bacteroidota bacterium]HEX05398.1 hypothetical protein [Bacteroidota bacterium]
MYQKTLHVQREVEHLQDWAEKNKQLRLQFTSEEHDRRKKDTVDVTDERASTRRSQKDAHREKRRDYREKEEAESAKDEVLEDDDVQEMRRRNEEDDHGKGERLDIEG